MTTISTDLSNGIATVAINRPEARNALNRQLRADLADEFLRLARLEDVRAVILTGTREFFVAGADLKELREVDAVSVVYEAAETMWQPLRDFPKPVIAAVNGWALGGGCELAMHADVIVAGESAKFGQPEVRLGLIPGAGGTQRLTRAVGKFKAMYLLLTGELIGAAEAEAIGLVTEVVPDDKVLGRALEIAATIAGYPAFAVRKIKEVVLNGADMSLPAALKLERSAFQQTFATEDRREGIEAFLGRRKPTYVGR